MMDFNAIEDSAFNISNLPIYMFKKHINVSNY